MPGRRSADVPAIDPPTARHTRRGLLVAAGVAGSAGLGGCLGVAGDGDQVGTDESARTDPDEAGDPTQPIDVAVEEPTAEATVSMPGDHANRFGPQLVHVAVGGRVTWRNDDPDHDHDVVSIGGRAPEDAAGWSTGLLETGETSGRTFSEPGVYDYVCTPHASRMVGRVVVGTPDPETEPALSAGSDGLAGDEARAVLAALDDRTRALLGDGQAESDESACDCPD
ncbi:cupredoxin domain-containing protein [Halorubrum sp. DTA46]|uniref:cupredoxin domain-containing protein n=1 Tax=Halorubrum sp. DTA46 TaxID=3402162 RepID=UPI003AAB0AF7